MRKQGMLLAVGAMQVCSELFVRGCYDQVTVTREWSDKSVLYSVSTVLHTHHRMSL